MGSKESLQSTAFVSRSLAFLKVVQRVVEYLGRLMCFREQKAGRGKMNLERVIEAF